MLGLKRREFVDVVRIELRYLLFELFDLLFFLLQQVRVVARHRLVAVQLVLLRRNESLEVLVLLVQFVELLRKALLLLLYLAFQLFCVLLVLGNELV